MTTADIALIVGGRYGASVAALQNASRDSGLTWPRYLAAWACLTYGDADAFSTGNFFNRTRSWAAGAVLAVEERQREEAPFAEIVAEIACRLSAPPGVAGSMKLAE